MLGNYSASVPAPTVCVSFTIDRTAAILAGNATFGKEHAWVAPSSLTETQRKTLVSLNWKNDAYVLAGHKTVIASAKDVDVPALLDEIAEHQREVEETNRKTRLHHYSNAVNAAVKWLEEPDEKHVGETRYQYNSPPRFTVIELHVSYLNSLRDDHAEFQDPRAEAFLKAYPERLERAKQLAAKMQKERDAEAADRAAKRQIEEERIEKEKEEKEHRRLHQLADWVDTHGTASQKKRLIASLLPQEEILTGMRKYAFSSLDAFGRYDRMTKAEVREAISDEYDVYGDVDVEFSVEPATSATDEEFEALEKIGEIIRKVYPDAKVELLAHRGEAERAKVYSSRKSVKVTIPFGDFEFTREYAAPLEPAA